jgi:hypothetical protein
MSVYKGSQKEGKIYYGRTKIGKVYKGNELVYQSSKSLRMYSFGGTVSNGTLISDYLVGSRDTQALMIFLAGIGGKIYKTQGILGQSGSQICYALQDSYSWDKWVPYSQTFVTNGVNVYCYYARGGGFVDASSYLVLEGATTEYVTQGFGEPTIRPASVTNEGVDAYGNGKIIAWTPQYDKIWTINGVYDV